MCTQPKVGFGLPYWWYPDYYYSGYYGYPYDYASYDYSPVYDYRYCYGLATAVQTELSRRGYYRGSIDGVIGFGSREAIRTFQKAQGLSATGPIDPALLKALKLPAVPRELWGLQTSPIQPMLLPELITSQTVRMRTMLPGQTISPKALQPPTLLQWRRWSLPPSEENVTASDRPLRSERKRCAPGGDVPNGASSVEPSGSDPLAASGVVGGVRRSMEDLAQKIRDLADKCLKNDEASERLNRLSVEENRL
jgi:Putative peptidoglycan binding domain